MPLVKASALTAPTMRNFDLRAELKETADRRKRPADRQHGDLEKGGVASISARLAEMFPGLPGDTVQAVVSELFRADSGCSRQQLADKSLATLLEIANSTGQPQAVTSFEPPSPGSPSPSPRFGEDQEQREEPCVMCVLRTTARVLVGCICKDGQSQEAACYQLLDTQLAELLALPESELRTCVYTLNSVLARIAEAPKEEKFRRLRRSNARFTAEVGRHESAVALLLHAGFHEDSPDGEAVLVFNQDPKSPAFARIQQALQAAAESLLLPDSAEAQAPKSAAVPRRVPAASSLDPERELRRQRVAALTEQRLQDPRGFREDTARRRRAANRVVGGAVQQRPPTAEGSAQPARRAQHFTLSDVDRLRVQEEISNTPNYAEEYRQTNQATPAGNYSLLVARSYDPELLARQALDGTNRYRASQGLVPLRWHDGIARIARIHAEQMASGQATFSHDGFDARVRAYPVAHRSAAENLALNSGVSDVAGAAVEGWIKSPGHERNLRGAFNLCGIGVARSSNGTFYLTQLFANAF